MRFPGAKHHTAQRIAGIINPMIGSRIYLEPFSGSLNVGLKVNADRKIFSDVDRFLIQMWIAVQNGWIPPTSVSEELYRDAKLHKDGDKYDEATLAFIGYACSFAAKWFGGYARDHVRVKTNYAEMSGRAIDKKRPFLKGNVEFHSCSYQTWLPENALIYCDPPYANTTAGYRMNRFDSAAFWEQVKVWVRLGNIVLISEFTAPEWVGPPIAQYSHSSNMAAFNSFQEGTTRTSYVDRLFLVY